MKSRRYIVLVLSVLLIAVFLLIFTDPWSTLRGNDKRIELKHVSEVDRIVLTNSYDSVLLVKEDGLWMLNGQETASAVPVENLLIAAERLEISSIVSAGSESGRQGENRGKVRRISYYGGEKVIRSYDFQALGDRYMVTPPGSDQSYFVSVAGYPGLNLDRVFSSSANHYREHLLIDLLPSEISEIHIELSTGQGFSFTQTESGDINCVPSNDQTTLPAGELNDLSTRLLFSYFTSIRYDSKSGFSAEALSRAGTANQRMAKLQVKSFKGEDHSLQIFPYQKTSDSGPHLFKALVIYNNDPEALVVNYIYLDVLMRKLSHYFGDK